MASCCHRDVVVTAVLLLLFLSSLLLLLSLLSGSCRCCRRCCHCCCHTLDTDDCAHQSGHVCVCVRLTSWRACSEFIATGIRNRESLLADIFRGCSCCLLRINAESEHLTTISTPDSYNTRPKQAGQTSLRRF